MPTSRKPLEINSGRLFRLSFLIIFIVLEWIVWEQVRQRPVRVPRHRVQIVLRRPGRPDGRLLSAAVPGRDGHPGGEHGRPADPDAALECVAQAGVRPLGVDVPPPGRRDAGGERAGPMEDRRTWRPGALVLTKRRIWFLPAGWDVEPWSIAPRGRRAGRGPAAGPRPVPAGAQLARLIAFHRDGRGSCILRRGRSRRGPGLVRADPIPRYRPAPAPAPRPKESSMPERFTVLIADFLDETSIESAVLGDIADLVMARATVESELARHLPEADAIILFHDLSILGEPSFARRRGAAGSSARGSGTTTSTWRPRPGTAWSSATCPTTGPRRSPTTRSCSCWRWCGGCSRRTRRSAAGRGTTGPPWAPPAPRQDVRRRRLRPDRHRDGPRAKALGLDVVFYDPYLRQGMDKALGIRRVYRARRPAAAEPLRQPALLPRRGRPATSSTPGRSRGCARARS